MIRMRRFIQLVLAIAIAVALLLWFQSSVPTQEARVRADLSGKIDFETLFGQITAESVEQTHERIVRFPNRLAGSPGDIEASRYVEEEFRRLGLEVVVQTFPITVPMSFR